MKNNVFIFHGTEGYPEEKKDKILKIAAYY